MDRKVLFVHDGPIQNDRTGKYYGGTLNDSLIQRYRYLGDQITFLMRVQEISKEDAGRYSMITEQKFSVVKIPNVKSIKGYLKYSKQANQTIIKAVRENDLIICRLPSLAGTRAAKVALRLGKPLLIEYVACAFASLWNYDWRGKMLAHIKMWQQKRLMKDMPFVIYVTQEFLQKRYPTNGKWIACSNVELQKPNLIEEVINIKKHDSAGLVIGTVGAVGIIYKGQDSVIEAVSLLKKKGIDVSYKMVGGGDATRLRKLITHYDVEDRVEVIGKMEHREIFKFLKKIDLYIQPSKTEGLPRALVEAMSVGCPALGSNVGGIPELLPEECIFRAGSPSEIAKLIENITPAKLEQLSERNFNEAKSYQKDILLQKRLLFYEKFLLSNDLSPSAMLLSKLDELRMSTDKKE